MEGIFEWTAVGRKTLTFLSPSVRTFCHLRTVLGLFNATFWSMYLTISFWYGDLIVIRVCQHHYRWEEANFFVVNSGLIYQTLAKIKIRIYDILDIPFKANLLERTKSKQQVNNKCQKIQHTHILFNSKSHPLPNQCPR